MALIERLAFNLLWDGLWQSLAASPWQLTGLPAQEAMIGRGAETGEGAGQVCVMQTDWVKLVLPKLEGIDVNRLSGGATTQVAIAAAVAAAEVAAEAAAEATTAGASALGSKAVSSMEKAAAARARFLARQAAKPVKPLKR